MRLLKSCFSLMLCFLFTGIPFNSIANESEEFYPDAVYDISSELDDDGKWIYRELAINGGIEESDANKDNIVYSTYKSTTYSIDNAVKRTGNSSYKAVLTSNYAGVGVKLNASHVDAAKYRLSYYINPSNNLSKVTNRLPYFADNGKGGYARQDGCSHSYSQTMNAGSWNYVSDTITFASVSGKPNELSQLSYAGFSVDSGVPSEGLTLYLDDFSVRRMPSELDNLYNARSHTKSISVTDGAGEPKDSGALLENGDKIIFKYSLDIDPRTVSHDTISVNGEAATSEIKSVECVTDEATRVSTITITLGELNNDTNYTISLDSIKDAWGRDVVGAKSFNFKSVPVINSQITFKKNGVVIDKLESGQIDVYVDLSSNIGTVSAQLLATVCEESKFTSVTPKAVTIEGSYPAVSDERQPDFTLNVKDGEVIRLYLWTVGDYPYPILANHIFDTEGLEKSEY